jgi:hypothetical protein
MLQYLNTLQVELYHEDEVRCESALFEEKASTLVKVMQSYRSCTKPPCCSCPERSPMKMSEDVRRAL